MFNIVKSGDRTQYGVVEYVADFTTDIETAPINVAPGSKLFCIEDSTTYILSPDGIWTIYVKGSASKATGVTKEAIIDIIEEQPIENLQTENKTVINAINELKLTPGTNLEIKDNIISTIGISDYNFDQTPIGFWIDGKTIVRQVFEITEGLAKDNWIKVADKPHNFVELVKAYGVVGGTAAAKGAQSTTDISIYVNTEGVFCKQNFTGYPAIMYVILEYTV